MAISPWMKGATRPSWTLTVLKDDKTPLDITGATFTGKLIKRGTTTTKAMTVGSFSITDATNGVFTYAPVTGDVDTAGIWRLQVTLTISSQTYIPRFADIEIVETF